MVGGVRGVLSGAARADGHAALSHGAPGRLSRHGAEGAVDGLCGRDVPHGSVLPGILRRLRSGAGADADGAGGKPEGGGGDCRPDVQKQLSGRAERALDAAGFRAGAGRAHRRGAAGGFLPGSGCARGEPRLCHHLGRPALRGGKDAGGAPERQPAGEHQLRSNAGRAAGNHARGHGGAAAPRAAHNGG